MPTYKGNAGHLMQHWTLCEMLQVAARKGVTGLNFIDAHAMAPLATKKVGKPGLGKDKLFKLAESRLPNIGDLAVAYGQAWHQLTSGHCPPRKGYPNSAAFVEQLWEGDFSMLLCETEPKTRKEIKSWLRRADKPERRKMAKLFCGDWRDRFKKGLPSPVSAKLEDGSLTLVSFDPYVCSQYKDVRDPKCGYLYIEDIELAMRAMACLHSNILIQLSTYSARNNLQGAVISSMNQVLVANDFRLLAIVHLDGHMMSLVYERDVSWASELADLPGRFDEWLRQLSHPDK